MPDSAPPPSTLPGSALRQLRIVPLAWFSGLGGRGSAALIERHYRFYRHTWTLLISGFFEPLF